ncbi:MAG: hypothetical protein N2588_10060 [Rhodovarius sp.]|nr:hypothetical protein [Rhodovarius sp.]
MPKRNLQKLGLDTEELLARIARDYRDFLIGNAAYQEIEAAKLFRARHDAGRAGLAHLEALLRLAAAQGEGAEPSALLDALRRARAALAEAASGEDGADDDPAGG